MIAEVIAIGDELTSGQRLDTNSQWLSGQLGDLGVAVRYHTTVADELAPIVEALRIAAGRADVVVVTGGLGPTADDLTREALAALANVPLVQDDAALAHIQNIYARRKRPMPRRNVVQAMFPKGSRVIANPQGTAPGIDIDVARAGEGCSRIFALPGVPAEMKQMWAATVAPAIGAMIPPAERRVIRHRRVKCFGVGESDLEAMLPDLIRRDYYPRVGITVSKATITLRVTALEDDEAACHAAMQPTLKTIRDCLGDLIFGEEDDELQHAVARLLAERRQTLATAEWGTAGLLSRWLNDVPEPRTVYRGGIVINAANVLGGGNARLAGQLDLHGTGSAEMAQAMAQHCREMFASDYALAVADIPAGDAEQFFIALATPEETLVRPSRTLGHPAILLPRSAKQALNLLRLTLLGKEA